MLLSKRFFFTTIAWVFFRSESVGDALLYLNYMFIKLSIPSANRSGMVFVILFCALDWLWRKNEREPLNLQNKYFRWILYIFLAYLIAGHFQIIDSTQFIYFQF